MSNVYLSKMIRKVLLYSASGESSHSSWLEDKLTVAFCMMFIGHQVCLHNSFDLPFHHEKYQPS